MIASTSRVRFAEDSEDVPPSKRKKIFTSFAPVVKSNHPQGVLPSGNKLLYHQSLHDIREPGLGFFHVLPDSIILLLLGTFDAQTLLAFGALSRTCFAYASHEPLWKSLVIASSLGALQRWEGSWRRTYISLFGHTSSDGCWPTSDIRAFGLYSDDLYQVTLCARTSLHPYFIPHPRRPRSNIPLHSEPLSTSSFSDLYARPSRPVLIQNALSRWKSYAHSVWTPESLEARFGHVAFRCEAFDVPFSVYRAYSSDCDYEDSPLYLFDSRFVEKTVGVMGEEYRPFPFFGKDLFELLGNDRPNFRWLIIGPARSGSTFHKDPNGTSAWNAVLTGRKGWVMFPPRILPPGVYTNDDESEVTSPLSIPEWFLTYFDHAWETYGPNAKDPKLRGTMIVGVCGPGEVVYVPSGWWHLVVNLEESVAVTQNFVGEDELMNVLKFMRDKPDQMSGFKGELATSPDEIYRRFTAALQRDAPGIYEKACRHLPSGPTAVAHDSIWDKVKKPMDAADSAPFSFGFGDELDLEEEEDVQKH